jgi:hypothetical protein
MKQAAFCVFELLNWAGRQDQTLLPRPVQPAFAGSLCDSLPLKMSADKNARRSPNAPSFSLRKGENAETLLPPAYLSFALSSESRGETRDGREEERVDTTDIYPAVVFLLGSVGGCSIS